MTDDIEKVFNEILADIFDREKKRSAAFAPFRTPAVRPSLQFELDSILRRVEATESGCWEWTGAKNAKGYGRVKYYDGKKYRIALPHRVVAHAIGKLDSVFDKKRNQCVMHKCDNPKCCRPDHLDVGTLSDNMKDCARKGRIPQQNRKRPPTER